MSLITAIDAALATAEAAGGRSFRIHLKEAEVGVLRSTGALEEPVGGQLAAGAYKGINVSATVSERQLMAQPEDRFTALHVAIMRRQRL